MILITLEPQGSHTRVELDGVDISKRLRRIEVEASVEGPTIVILTLAAEACVIAGTAGRLEFVSPPLELDRDETGND